MKKTIKKRCNVDIVSVSVKKKNIDSEYTFEKILLSEDLSKNEEEINKKMVQFKVISNTDDYIIGLLTTTLDKDLPPKINKKSKVVDSIGINDDEGLLYGNIMLFSKSLNILFYEVNKDSIYLNSFKKFIIKVFSKNEDFISGNNFDIDFSTIFKKNEYDRALSLAYYKKFKLKVHQPSRLLEVLKKKKVTSTFNRVKEDLTNQLKSASNSGSQMAEIKFAVNQVRDKKSNLQKTYMNELIRFIGGIIKDNNEGKEFIDVVEICGYEDDYETRITPVDLIGDVVKGAFEMDVDRISNNLKETTRANEILELYKKHKDKLLEYV